MPKKFVEKLDRLSSRPMVKYGVYLVAVILFFALILVPPILGIVIKWSSMQEIFGNSQLMNRALDAVKNSFVMAVLVSILDVAAGIPMAWLIARSRSKWANILDTLADVPFIVPTAVLGYSLLLFWYRPEGISAFFGGSLVSPGWFLVALLHFTFSYPVVVRVIVGALLDYKIEYEQAARTLGAPPFTTARTVTFGIIKPSLIAAFILAFARSISETGATMMVAGAFENGPIFIQNTKDVYVGATVFVSLILIVVSCLIFAAVRVLGGKLKLPFKKAWPTVERKISYSSAAMTRNGITLLTFFIIILIPSLFAALPAFKAASTDILHNALLGVYPWGEYWQSLVLSYSLGAAVTVLNVLIGLPMAIIVARKRLGKTSSALNVLVDIPIIVPSVALGVSLRFFWKETLAFIPDILLLVFAHLAITYPYFVRSMSAAVERISIELEEASRTLGAKPFCVFRTVIFPLTKYSMFSGAIMVFTRSVSETGATMAVTSLKTTPVVLVDWVKGKIAATSLEIGLGCGFLILISFIILLALRLIVGGKGRY
ncbi:iron ABC transporter permease [Candidatus Bathyarchaeota archaeon]|nr:iron ABC transporter permease [Candidatus Bathyarchaeota archaeon]